MVRLTTPDGIDRCQQVLRSGQGEFVQTWPAQPGRWELRIDAADFTGSYGIELEATDTPIQVHVDIAADPPQ